MTWLQRYRIREYLKECVWLLPVLAIIAAPIVSRILWAIDTRFDLHASIRPDNARQILSAASGSMLTFFVFVASALLIVVQLASTNLTPRIIGLMFRSRLMQVSLAAFVFNFTFTLTVLVRIEDRVPQLTTRVAAYSSLLSIALFLYLLGYTGRLLRPSGILQVVAREGRRVIDHVYPRSIDNPVEDAGSANLPPATLVVRNAKEGVVLAIDVAGLVEMARARNVVIEIVPQVGDFVARNEPLFNIFGVGEISVDTLQHSIAMGQERNFEQDATFAFRVAVDIASKALSPAINDPTTAVLGIDQIHELLRRVGRRHLADDRIHDAAGNLRLIHRTPEWDDFVVLAVTEIRQFGATSVQIPRRLRAMLENLIETLPEERAPALRRELEFLSKTVARSFSQPEDQAIASISDRQGIGGRSESAR